MATLLSEASKLSNDVLLQGVIETIVKESPILQFMPFTEIVGNALTYNREKTLPTAEWHAPNDDWVTSPEITFDQLTATLKILGQNADVDNYIKATRSNIQDIEAAIIELTAKAVRHEFEQRFLYGNSALDANQMDGIIKLIDTATASDQVIAGHADGITLTLAHVDQLIDAVLGGLPDILLMSKRSRRKLNALARAAGSNLEVGTGKLGEFVQFYNGIPIGTNDWILNTHTVATSLESSFTTGACSTIYALRFGEGALCGITGPGGLQVEPIGAMETKDAARTRIKWYVGIADFSKVKRAALIGVKD